MPGRPIPPEATFEDGRYADPTLAWRRGVLRETLAAFENAEPPERFARLAQTNVARWHDAAAGRTGAPELRVVAGDWGAVTHAVTREFGATFGVLNMANAYSPGGGYVEGTVAQEENMFRRTDCHFSVEASQVLAETGLYRDEMSRLINGDDGRVYLDTSTPRVCVRGPEFREPVPTGYEWLPDDEVFPFFELRAAARDYRNGSAFDEGDARRRIVAQLDTLIEHGVRHAVLGASGCGAFRNPSEQIAAIYREELDGRRDAFACVVFAIYHAGYGPGNFEPFSKALADW